MDTGTSSGSRLVDGVPPIESRGLPIPRDAFEELLSRAGAWHGRRTDADVMRIATELAMREGISQDAWTASVREYTVPGEAPRRLGAVSGLRTGGIAGLGLGIGYYSGHIGTVDWLFGATLLGVGMLLAIRGARDRTPRATEVELSVWWISVPAGIMLGTGHFETMAIALSAVMLPTSIGLARWVRALIARRRSASAQG